MGQRRIALVSLVNAECQGLIVVGTCRGNEVSPNDKTLRDLEDRGTSITNIQVTNLSVGMLVEMISDAGVIIDRCQLS